jgi:hypothetical protein
LNISFAKSDELRVALAPSAIYVELIAREGDITWVSALRRPAFVVLLIGTVVTIAATGRVTLQSVVLTAAAWSFAVVLQIGIGAAMIGSARRRRLSMARALDLWFAGHLPWSAWLLLVMASIRLVPFLPLEALLVTMILPMAWTAAIVTAYCRTVLGNAAGAARLRAAVHQAVTLALLLSFIAWSAGGWFRLAG